MYQWLCEALRAWFVPLPPCRRDPPPEPWLPSRPRKRRRHHSTLLPVEDPYQEQTKKQKLGIVGTLTQGIATLIALPSQLTARYLQSGDQHAAATDEAISSTSETLAASKMELPSAVQVSELEKRAVSDTTPYPVEEETSTCHGSMAFLRPDSSAKIINKKSHNSVQSGLVPGRPAIHKHLLETSILDSGRHLRKPHYTVEEGVQREEREKYKSLLEQEKGKSPKNHSVSTVTKHLDGNGYARGLQKPNRYMEGDAASLQALKNGMRNFVPLYSKRNVNSSVTVSERSSKPEESGVQKKETVKWPLAADLSEEVSLRLNLGQEGPSCRRHSFVEKNKHKCLSLEKAVESLPDLTEDMEREITTVLNCGREDEILTSAFKLNITCGDIQTLKNQQLLNDVVINFYMNLLVERNKRLGLPVLYTFNTFFYTKLNSEGYNAVKRWTKGVDLFQHDIILVPIHIQVHWALVVIDMRRETIKYFDSMGQNGHMICKRLLQFLQEESKAKRHLDIKASAWTLYSVESHEIPQQLNDSDCGMFVCKYADFISRDKPIAFTQCHIPYFRKKMVWEILHHQLL